jgi:hypothetical protein
MRFVAIAVGLVAAALVLRMAYFVLGPSIDNFLGVLTQRDLRLFRRHVVGGVTLDQLVMSRAGLVVWTVQHHEYIWASEIEARAESGVYRWELSHLAPRPWLASQTVYLTPLNRPAAELTPELLPQGLRDIQIPPAGYRAGVIYDIAQPAKAREHFGPWLRKHFSGLFS